MSELQIAPLGNDGTIKKTAGMSLRMPLYQRGFFSKHINYDKESF
jgi:hypothetical protein